MVDSTTSSVKATAGSERTGTDFLERITFDVFFEILSFLDAVSALHLTSCCRVFHNLFLSDTDTSAQLWHGLLRRTLAPFQPTPHSILTTSSAARRAALAPSRFLASILHPSIPLTPVVHQYRLEYAPSELRHPFQRDYPDSTWRCFLPFNCSLLPGGRYIIGFAIAQCVRPSLLGDVEGDLDVLGASTFLLCWDTMNPLGWSPVPVSSDGEPRQGDATAHVYDDGTTRLLPVAQLEIPGMLPSNIRREWVQMQSEDDVVGTGTRSVIIAMRLAEVGDGYSSLSLVHHIVRLAWPFASSSSYEDPSTLAPSPTTPAFELAGLLADDNLYYGEQPGSHRDFWLSGDYLVIETLVSVFVWNWRLNRVGVIDDEGHEWANGAGFIMSLRSPMLHIIPHDLHTVLSIHLPSLPLFPLHTFECLVRPKPEATTEQPFIPRGVELLAFSRHVALNSRWITPSPSLSSAGHEESEDGEIEGFSLIINNRHDSNPAHKIVTFPRPYHRRPADPSSAIAPSGPGANDGKEENGVPVAHPGSIRVAAQKITKFGLNCGYMTILRRVNLRQSTESRPDAEMPAYVPETATAPAIIPASPSDPTIGAPDAHTLEDVSANLDAFSSTNETESSLSANIETGRKESSNKIDYFAVQASVVPRTRRIRRETDSLQLRLRAFRYDAQSANFGDAAPAPDADACPDSDGGGTRVITIDGLDGASWVEEDDGDDEDVHDESRQLLDVTCLPTGLLMLQRQTTTFTSVAVVQLY